MEPKHAPRWVTAWGIGGVVFLLSSSVLRLARPAFAAFQHELHAHHIAFLVPWCIFMLYSEAWRGFHLRFAPRVVERAFSFPPSPVLIAVAPLVCTGLLYASRRRTIVTWSLIGGILLLVLLIRQLEQPWRGLIDLGVVLGLAGGVLSVLWHAARAYRGQLPGVPPEWPEGYGDVARRDKTGS